MSKVAIRTVKLPSGEATPALGLARGAGPKLDMVELAALHGGAAVATAQVLYNLMHAEDPSPATGQGMRDRLFSHPTRRGRDLGWKALRSRRL